MGPKSKATLSPALVPAAAVTLTVLEPSAEPSGMGAPPSPASANWKLSPSAQSRPSSVLVKSPAVETSLPSVAVPYVLVNATVAPSSVTAPSALEPSAPLTAVV